MLNRILLSIILALSLCSVVTAQERVGVDTNQAHPLSLREALAMALENNKDIEVARQNVRIAEFDYLGSQGAYDPRFTTQAFYERIESPISSFLAGGQNGSTIQTDYTGTARLEGQTPALGGNYRLVKINPYNAAVTIPKSAIELAQRIRWERLLSFCNAFSF